jgi:hypothetical protein
LTNSSHTELKGADHLAWLIGTCAIVFGLLLIALSVRLRAMQRHAALSADERPLRQAY